jgi:hypothetical protein
VVICLIHALVLVSFFSFPGVYTDPKWFWVKMNGTHNPCSTSGNMPFLHFGKRKSQVGILPRLAFLVLFSPKRIWRIIGRQAELSSQGPYLFHFDYPDLMKRTILF